MSANTSRFRSVDARRSDLRRGLFLRTGPAAAHAGAGCSQDIAHSPSKRPLNPRSTRTWSDGLRLALLIHSSRGRLSISSISEPSWTVWAAFVGNTVGADG